MNNPGKRGRKEQPLIVLSDDQLEQIEQMAAQGLNLSQIVQALDISHDTLQRRRDDQLGVQDAIDRGNAKGIAIVSGKLMSGITGEGFAPGVVQAIQYYLNNRAGWSNNPGEQAGDTHNYFVVGAERIDDPDEWASKHKPALTSQKEH